MSDNGVLPTEREMTDEYQARSQTQKLAHSRFLKLVEGSELWELMDRLPQSAMSAVVREKAEDVYAHARLSKKSSGDNGAMLEKRVVSLSKAIGEWLAQEKNVLHEGPDSYYTVGQRVAEEFAAWASQPQAGRSR